MLRAILDAIRSAISGVWNTCWWCARLPGQLLFGGSSAPAPGAVAYHAELDDGPEEPPPAAAAVASTAAQMDLVSAVRRATAERLAAIDERREPVVDERLPHWTRAWLTGLDAGQLRLVMQTPGSVLRDVLSGVQSTPGAGMETAEKMSSQSPTRISLAARIEARIAARKNTVGDEPDGPTFGR